MNSKGTPSRQTLLPIILIVVGVLLIAVVVIWQTTLSQPGTPAVVQQDPNIPYPDVNRISLDEAKTAYDQKQALFVDVRDAASYQQGHVPGAINIPLNDLDSRLSELSPTQWIITYCT